ncbi:hypothetical protein GCM10017556_18450 [Micromonospora sagamiensis]|nr:hypothetical protein GCM10017556_18450 [Micromonospora sagamiensis]
MTWITRRTPECATARADQDDIPVNQLVWGSCRGRRSDVRPPQVRPSIRLDVLPTARVRPGPARRSAADRVARAIPNAP